MFKGDIIKQKNIIESLEINLKILYILNLLDLFFTKMLLHYGSDMFVEANTFMKPIINGPVSILLKVILFGAVLLYWYKRNLKSNEKELKISILASKICVILYLLINISHFIYIGMFFYLKI